MAPAIVAVAQGLSSSGDSYELGHCYVSSLVQAMLYIVWEHALTSPVNNAVF